MMLTQLLKSGARTSAVIAQFHRISLDLNSFVFFFSVEIFMSDLRNDLIEFVDEFDEEFAVLWNDDFARIKLDRQFCEFGEEITLILIAFEDEFEQTGDDIRVQHFERGEVLALRTNTI